MKARRLATILLAVAGASLAAALLVVARPSEIGALLQSSHPAGLAMAAAWWGLVVILRGARLSLVLGNPVTIARGVAASSALQFAVGLLPMRLGELALLPILARVGVPGKLRALSLVVLLRFLDVLALLVWAVVATAAVGISTLTALAGLLAMVLLGLLGIALLTLWLRRRARHWRTRRGLRRGILRQALTVRRELLHRARSPWRVIGVSVASLGAWGCIWGLTVALLRAMEVDWPVSHVLLGVVGASVGASLPLNAVGNFGTLEGGWAAALHIVGVPTAQALAAGFATHLLTLVLTSALGAAALCYLVFARSPLIESSQNRASS